METNISKNLLSVSGKVDKEKKYWLNQLSGELNKSHFPYDYQPGEASPGSRSIKTTAFALPGGPDSVVATLLRFSSNSDYNLYVFLAAGIITLLHRYTADTDIITAVPIYKQNEEGEYVNTVLALRNRLKETMSFKDLLVYTKKNLAEANENLNYPLEKILYHLDIETSTHEFPLSSFGILLENIHYKKYLLHLNLPIIFSFHRNEQQIQGLVEYDSQLHRPHTIERLIIHLLELFRSITKNINLPLADINILSPDERYQLLDMFNQTGTPPGDRNRKTVYQLFQDQALKNTSNTAVLYTDPVDNRRFSLQYKELEYKAHQLGYLLREKGVTPDSIVMIMLEPCIEMIIAVMAVLDAGAAYLPIAPGTPKARVHYILKDSAVRILLSRKNFTTELTFPGEILDVGDDNLYNNVPANKPGAGPNNPGSAVYMIYTSGTTGKPKGVLVKNQNLVNYVTWFTKTTAITAADQTMLTSSFAFDLGYTSIYSSLLNGARLHILPEQTYLDIEKLTAYIQTEAITYIKITPSFFTTIINSTYFSTEVFRTVRLVIFGGEEINTKDVETLHTLCKDLQIMNHYGPTETTIGSIAQFIDPRDIKAYIKNPTIGSPLDNTRVYICHPNLKLLPVGIPGELCISGAGVAPGYANRQELTKEKFLENPYVKGDILYKTGDLAKWLPDGKIRFLGRVDHQVKIRGFRVELGEIENQVLNFPLIKEAAVLTRDDNTGSKQLAAYVVPDPVQAFTARQILSWESQGLLKDKQRCEMPDGMPIFYLNRNETDIMYRNIFQQRNYLKHGITLDEGACVFDVGANIGMFSLFVSRQYQNAEIYTFEPIPAIFEILQLNMSLYLGNTRNFNYGISKEEGEVEFTYYPNVSIISGRFANIEEEKAMVKSFMEEEQSEGDRENELSAEQIDQLLANRLSTANVTCKVNPLSTVIQESGVERIDLLKIIAEKSELEVLSSIADHQWPKIRQLVVEVYDRDGRLDRIVKVLENHGYRVTISQEGMQKNHGLFNLFALRPDSQQVSTTEEQVASTSIPAPGQEKTWDSPEQLIRHLKNHLAAKLPDYMIPSHFIALPELPLTANGKLDRKALPQPLSPDSGGVHAPPTNRNEEILAEIWQEVLGLKAVGINDNLFEIGGDSIKVIQISSRLNRYDLKVDISDIFLNPTIKELSKQLKKKERFIDQGTVSGKVELTPAQEWFSRESFSHKQHFNLAVLLYNKIGFNRNLLEKTFKKIVEHHDALRIVYREEGDTIIQYNRDMNEDNLYHLQVLDVKNSETVEEEIQQHANQLQRSIDLANGPLLKSALFNTNEGDHLLIVIHHLVVDGISWRILLEDFSSAYQQIERGEEIKLQEKTDSFLYWALKLVEYSGTYQALKEIEYWKRIDEIEIQPLPGTNPISPQQKIFKNIDSAAMMLEEAETEKLLKKVHQAYNTEINDILLAALALAVKQWTGIDKVLIDLEGHGREPVIKDIDISRTVGWFTSHYPVLLEMDRSEDLSYLVKYVKESLRKIPNKGIGYGILKYLTPEEKKEGLHFQNEPQISFNYLGDFGPAGSSAKNNSNIQLSGLNSGDNLSHSFPWKSTFNINGMQVGEKLSFVFNYNKYENESTNVEKFVSTFKTCLITIIEHCTSREENELTPTDLGDKELTLEELEEIKNIIDI